MSKSAIILGASGLTGGLLLDELLSDTEFKEVTLFSRSSVNKKHPKLTEHLVDLFELKNHASSFNADVVFCCIGTTKKKTPNQERYHKIDFGIPVTAAQLCKQNDIPSFLVISAMGANKSSAIFYNKTKGEMEEAVLEAGIEQTHILRPALITGNREESRRGERFAQFLFKGIDWLMIGPLKKYRSVPAIKIAKAMIHLSKFPADHSIINSAQIHQIAKQKR